MIKFPCLCGVKFTLPEDMAGRMFQCEKCGRLVTVPTLDDLKNIDADGAYALDADHERPTHRPDTGMLPPDSAIQAPPVMPRYDPFTGELIRAVGVEAGIVSAEARKTPRAPPQSKITRGLAPPPPTMAWITLFGEMLMAKNVTVLLCMTIGYFLLAFGIYWFYIMGAYMFFFFPVVVLAFCVSYFSAVVQETGPGEREDLPPPLRYVEWRADIWDPLIHIVLSVALCLGPAAAAFVLIIEDPIRLWAAGILGGIGAIFFPALFLTASVDGIVANFRPDRLLGVIRAAGFVYLPVLIGWAAGMFCLANGMLALLGVFSIMWNPFGRAFPRPWIGFGWGYGFCFVVAGLYFSYYACWLLGVIWRKHHAKFPWIAQRFVKDEAAPGKPIPAKQPVPRSGVGSHD
jgi:hypothetical protein